MVKIEYIAGLVDGEGYIRIAKNKYRLSGKRNPTYQLYVGINMTDPRPIKSIQEIFGGKIYVTRIKTSKHRTLFGWIVTSRKAIEFITAVRPHLLVKGEEADVAITFQNHIDSSGRQWSAHKGLPKSVIDFRESLFQEISHLKHVQHEI